MDNFEESENWGKCSFCGEPCDTAYDCYTANDLGMTDWKKSESMGMRTISWINHYADFIRYTHYVCDKCFDKKVWQVYFWGKDRHMPYTWTDGPVPKMSIFFAGSVVIAVLMLIFIPRSWVIMNIVIGFLFVFSAVILFMIIKAMSRILFARGSDFGNKLSMLAQIEKDEKTNAVHSRRRFFTPNQYQAIMRQKATRRY